MRKSQNKANGCLGAFLAMVFIVIFILWACGISNSKNTQQKGDVEIHSSKNNTTTTQFIDPSLFSGEPAISATINLEKKSNFSFYDADILLHNCLDKDIIELQMFLVCVDELGVEQNECVSLSLTDIKANTAVRDSRFISLKTTEICEYQAYITYILYADESEWGIREANRFSVISCGSEVNVCYYEDGVCKDAVEKVYSISYSVHMVSNSHVGDSWSYGIMHNDQLLDTRGDVSVLLDAQAGPKLTAIAVEHDSAENDIGKAEILFSNLSIGECETVLVEVMVVEGDGRYIGHKAYIEFVVTIKRIG